MFSKIVGSDFFFICLFVAIQTWSPIVLPSNGIHA